MTTTPIVECDRVHPGLQVADVAAAVAFYTERLGFTLGFTWGEPVGFAGVNLGKAKHGLDYDCHASYRFVEREPT